jgi:hypothetical protein
MLDADIVAVAAVAFVATFTGVVILLFISQALAPRPHRR